MTDAWKQQQIAQSPCPAGSGSNSQLKKLFTDSCGVEGSLRHMDRKPSLASYAQIPTKKADYHLAAPTPLESLELESFKL